MLTKICLCLQIRLRNLKKNHSLPNGFKNYKNEPNEQYIFFLLKPGQNSTQRNYDCMTDITNIDEVKRQQMENKL